MAKVIRVRVDKAPTFIDGFTIWYDNGNARWIGGDKRLPDTAARFVVQSTHREEIDRGNNNVSVIYW